MDNQEFVLTQDNDGHWYVIPDSKCKDFDDWLGLDSDDEASWNVPEYAKEVGGSPVLVKFKHFRIE